jgi:hypothetical protein
MTALAAALVVLLAGPASIARAQDHGHGDAVTCESRDMHRTRCAVPWHDARLVEQTSDTSCVRGENWGIDGRGLWVNHGCGGRFVAAGGRDHSDNYHDGDHGDRDHGDHDHGGWSPEPGWDSRFNVGCESRDFQYHFCAVDLGGAGRVSIARQVSDSACIEGRTWGSNRAGIWVNNGCAAEFSVDRRWR